MVKLYHIYETSYAIFLILEHASGGRLWDYVSSYLQRSPVPCNDGSSLYVEQKNKAELSNVYSGKKVSGNHTTDNTNINLVDSDLTPSTNCPPSYVALFKKYAASMNKEDNVALARYKLKNVPFTDKESNTANEKTLSHSQNDDLISTLQPNCDTENVSRFYHIFTCFIFQIIYHPPHVKWTNY